MFTDLGYQPRYLAYVYYAPDDPHVTNPSQPGYVGSNASNGSFNSSNGGGGGGGGGGDAGAAALADMQSALASGALGKVAGPGATQTITPAGSSKSITYDASGNSTLSNFSVSPPGTQAPVDQFNISAASPTGPTTVYPPGEQAPLEEFQVNSVDGSQPSPAAFALSAAMGMPDTTSSDDQNKNRTYADNSAMGMGGSDIFALNAKGAPIPGGGTQPGAFGQGQGAYDAQGNIPLPGGGHTVNGMIPNAAPVASGQ